MHCALHFLQIYRIELATEKNVGTDEKPMHVRSSLFQPME